MGMTTMSSMFKTDLLTGRLARRIAFAAAACMMLTGAVMADDAPAAAPVAADAAAPATADAAAPAAAEATAAPAAEAEAPAPALPAHAVPLKLDSGDTSWMLISTGLVLMMTIPGLALFYAGMLFFPAAVLAWWLPERREG